MSRSLFPEKSEVLLAGLRDELPPGLHLGTCSWKYDDWRGLLYSSEKRINHLLEYGRHLESVEIDQWFWSLFGPDKVVLPKPHVVESYTQSVDEDFRFSVKAPNSVTLTHLYRKSRGDDLVANPHFFSTDLYAQFVKSLEPLGPKLGVIMLQFEYLNRQKMANLDTFMEQVAIFLASIPRDIPIAIECRNPNYMKEEYFTFLADHDVAPVFCQGYYMPSIAGLHSQFGTRIKGRAVIRLMGPDRDKIEADAGLKWDRVIDDRTNELADVVEMVRELLSRHVEIYTNVNNHYEGSAPRTIRKLASLLLEPTG
jgi:uncharacterized protein YecE (DUF72 family)